MITNDMYGDSIKRFQQSKPKYYIHKSWPCYRGMVQGRCERDNR